MDLNNQLAFLLLILIGLSFGCTSQNSKQKPAPKAVYIILDGISADVLEQTDTPNLDKISKIGGYTRATTGGMAGGYSESPTASAIGYNNLLTGTWANKHNVYDNNIDHPNYEYWSLYRLIETEKPALKTAIFSSWTDNRTKLIGEGLEESGGFQIDIVRDGYDIDTLSFPHDSAWVRQVDEKVVQEAAKSLKENAPDFSWIYLWYTDDTGHSFGDTEKYFESIKNADRQVGKIWNAIQERKNNFNEDWLIIVTTDHGRALPDGKSHGNQSERERTVWFATNADNLNEYFRNGKPQHVDLYPTIVQHLGIKIPKDVERELDGVPFAGSISLSNLNASVNKNQELLLKWDSWENSGEVEIKLAHTNYYKIGGKDEYQLVGTKELSSEKALINLNPLFDSIPDTLKVIVQGKHNQHSAWVVKK
ncbi:alkaline phosphatase family protein [Gracilimonas sp.]|uniref:alkaline phosphatase family protein n=1 Tax=Gracilimonas sp. TaxID=1974203 RepID=UPI00287131E0|nr:alkaline phosphatase family protein [Gracilimonas sp.]